MDKHQNLYASGNQSNPETGINRREMVRRLMMAGGAGLAVPVLAEGNPIGKHHAGGDAAGQAGPNTPTAQWTPAFLDQHQSDTLAILGERIIPGSFKAEVNRFIDLLLSVDTQDAQKKFLRSLSAFEAESLRQFSQPYKDLSEAQQNEILSNASTAHPGKAEDGHSEQVTMRDHFENLKSWVSDAYYSSEIGMKELGWTGEVFFTSFPGCQESSGH